MRYALGRLRSIFPPGRCASLGSRVKLQDQPFKVLQILLERPGELVTREELQSRIWPDASFGDFDHAVNIAVGKLRAALGDSAENPSFIETVPRRGYRFVATLDEVQLDQVPVDTQHSPAAINPPGVNGDGSGRVVSGLNRTLLALLAIVISGVLVGLGVFLGHRTAKSQPPDFQRLTFSRGTVYSARFAPDSHSVIYAASWDGGPSEIFSTNPKIHGAREASDYPQLSCSPFPLQAKWRCCSRLIIIPCSRSGELSARSHLRADLLVSSQKISTGPIGLPMGRR
jgi:DNA-binding winged helix-turn-helix (wHTH) protein